MTGIRSLNEVEVCVSTQGSFADRSRIILINQALIIRYLFGEAVPPYAVAFTTRWIDQCLLLHLPHIRRAP